MSIISGSFSPAATVGRLDLKSHFGYYKYYCNSLKTEIYQGCITNHYIIHAIYSTVFNLVISHIVLARQDSILTYIPNKLILFINLEFQITDMFKDEINH